MRVSYFSSIAACAAVAIPQAATAQLGEGVSESTGRPKFSLLRQNEDWSAFKPGSDARPLDSLKHIDLTDDGDVWMSIGGRFDSRFEAWDGFGFGATNPGNSDSFLLSHLFLHGDVHVGSRFRVFVEGYSADVLGRNDLPGGRRTLDTNSLALFQAFADIDLLDGEDDLVLRVGRQTLMFGRQRLVSPLPWANTWRTWDGVSAHYRTGDWSVTGFATYFVPVQRFDFDDSDDDREFYGIYASRPADEERRGLDLYVLGKTRNNVTINGTTGNERRHTFGFRSYGSLGGDYDGELEAGYQFGDVGPGDVNAWFASTVLGYKLGGDWKSRLFAGLDAASGDSRAGGNVGTFDQVFPLGHAYFGYADTIARQNVVAAHLGISMKPAASTTVSVTGHVFRLFDDNDGLYNVGGARARAATLGNEDVGQELDLFVKHVFTPQLSSYAGYSRVFAGGGLSASGPREDIDFFYCAVTARF